MYPDQPSLQKLSWSQILHLYPKEWVELIDYDWPDSEPVPTAGVVRVHAKTRKEFDTLTEIDPPQDSAYVFVGPMDKINNSTVRAFNRIEIVPNDS